jgi:two-component system LytT family response regulator
MTQIRTVIVDDVDLAREHLRRMLADEKDLEIVGEAADGRSALRAIETLAPDLVFLDVRLPDIDGFEIARRMQPGEKPVVIYVSAYDDKVVEAFDVNATDYVLKPFDRERFRRALDRARRKIAPEAVRREYLQRMMIKDRARTEIVATRDIDYIDVAGHYLCIHVGRTVHLQRGTLADLERQLDPAEFCRIHRSNMVRLDRVQSLTARRNGDYDVQLKTGAKLLMSRTFGETARQRLAAMLTSVGIA